MTHLLIYSFKKKKNLVPRAGYRVVNWTDRSPPSLRWRKTDKQTRKIINTCDKSSKDKTVSN